MRPRLFLNLVFLTFLVFPVHAQNAGLSKAVKEFVRVDNARIVLAHVRIIDGTPTSQNRGCYETRCGG